MGSGLSSVLGPRVLICLRIVLLPSALAPAVTQKSREKKGSRGLCIGSPGGTGEGEGRTGGAPEKRLGLSNDSFIELCVLWSAARWLVLKSQLCSL